MESCRGSQRGNRRHAGKWHCSDRIATMVGLGGARSIPIISALYAGFTAAGWNPAGEVREAIEDMPENGIVQIGLQQWSDLVVRALYPLLARYTLALLQLDGILQGKSERQSKTCRKMALFRSDCNNGRTWWCALYTHY